MAAGWILKGAVVSAVVLGGTGIFAGSRALDDDTERSDAGEIVEGGDLGAMAVQVGDCVLVPEEATEVETVEGVPCSEPHDGEAFAIFDLDQPAEFSLRAVEEASVEGCLDRWEGAVGTVYEADEELDVGYLYPTKSTWGDGDRQVTCFVLAIDGSPLVGSHLAGR